MEGRRRDPAVGLYQGTQEGDGVYRPTDESSQGLSVAGVYIVSHESIRTRCSLRRGLVQLRGPGLASRRRTRVVLGGGGAKYAPFHLHAPFSSLSVAFRPSLRSHAVLLAAWVQRACQRQEHRGGACKRPDASIAVSSRLVASSPHANDLQQSAPSPGQHQSWLS